MLSRPAPGPCSTQYQRQVAAGCWVENTKHHLLLFYGHLVPLGSYRVAPARWVYWPSAQQPPSGGQKPGLLDPGWRRRKRKLSLMLMRTCTIQYNTIKWLSYNVQVASSQIISVASGQDITGRHMLIQKQNHLYPGWAWWCMMYWMCYNCCLRVIWSPGQARAAMEMITFIDWLYFCADGAELSSYQVTVLTWRNYTAVSTWAASIHSTLHMLILQLCPHSQKCCNFNILITKGPSRLMRVKSVAEKCCGVRPGQHDEQLHWL